MIVSVILLTVRLELTFQFLPVASGLRSLSVTTDDPVLRYTTNREYIYSRDRNFNMVNRGRVNNAGFVNDQEYVHDDGAPLLVVIGDSYIQAQMAPYDHILHGRLAIAAQKSFACIASPRQSLRSANTWSTRATH